jgi:hypothetical protein
MEELKSSRRRGAGGKAGAGGWGGVLQFSSTLSWEKFSSVADFNRQRLYLAASNFCGSYLLTNNVGIKKDSDLRHATSG